MTVRLEREKDTHRIKTVESDDKSIIHEMVHDDIQLGALMRNHGFDEIVGSDGFAIKQDLTEYDRAHRIAHDTRYSESERRECENKIKWMDQKYNKR